MKTHGYSDASSAESNNVFSSGWNKGCQRTLCICGHRKGKPKPGTVHPICFRVAMVVNNSLSTVSNIVIVIMNVVVGFYGTLRDKCGQHRQADLHCWLP